MKMKTGLQKAIEIVGSISALSRALGVDRAAIGRWRSGSVPAHWIIPIEHATGVPREEIRPDLYSPPRPKRKKPT